MSKRLSQEQLDEIRARRANVRHYAAYVDERLQYDLPALLSHIDALQAQLEEYERYSKTLNKGITDLQRRNTDYYRCLSAVYLETQQPDGRTAQQIIEAHYPDAAKKFMDDGWMRDTEDAKTDSPAIEQNSPFLRFDPSKAKSHVAPQNGATAQNVETAALSFDEYQVRALETNKHLLLTQQGILELALGMSAEAGEVASKVYKWSRDGGTLDKGAVIKEIGDTLWFAAVLSHALSYLFSEVAQANLDKLADRARRGVIGGSGDER